MTTGITAATTAPTTTINNGLASLADNYQTFLSLLTTQLKNQDPLSPLDTNQFTQQLTQMTGVEQQLLSNQLLQQLVSNNQAGMTAGVALIGKQVTADTADTTLQGGQANWTYNLGADAASTTLQVVNSSGNVVWQGPATDSSTAGDHSFSWNGQDQSGVQLPDGGTYTLKIAATNAAGAGVNATAFVNGLASAVEQDGDVTMLTVGGSKVPLSSVVSVTAAS